MKNKKIDLRKDRFVMFATNEVGTIYERFSTYNEALKEVVEFWECYVSEGGVEGSFTIVEE